MFDLEHLGYHIKGVCEVNNIPNDGKLENWRAFLNTLKMKALPLLN